MNIQFLKLSVTVTFISKFQYLAKFILLPT